MQKLYAGFWETNQTPKRAVGASLLHLADTLGRELSKPAIQSYLAALAEFNREEIILAFSRATEECRFFPPPAILREYSGRAADGDPIAREAKCELLAILTAMRGPYGPELRDIPGKVIYGTEQDPRGADGRCTEAPIREPSTPFACSHRTNGALVRLGWGSKAAGIALLADHPSLKRHSPQDADPQYRQNQIRAADEILKRWVEAYREVDLD